MKEFMNWADFLNAASDAIFFLDLYSTLWFLNGGSLLQLYMFLIINEEKDCLEKSWSESLQKSQLRKANTQRVFEFKKSHAKQAKHHIFHQNVFKRFSKRSSKKFKDVYRLQIFEDRNIEMFFISLLFLDSDEKTKYLQIFIYRSSKIHNLWRE